MITVRTKYLGELRTEATHLRSGTIIQTDAPVDNNGRGELFSPTDLVASALGSCMITIMGIRATKEGIELKGTTAEITKVMSADFPRRIAKIEVTLKISAEPTLTASQIKVLELAARSCPVALSLHPDIEQAVSFSWNETLVG